MDSTQVIHAYLSYKYACFNKPEQDINAHYGRQPFVNPPFIDIDACMAYNSKLEHFRSLQLSHQVENISKCEQDFCAEQTIQCHLTELVHKLYYAYHDGFAHQDMRIPSLQELVEEYTTYVPERKAIIFHFFDILNNDPSDRQAYPFFENVVAFNNRIEVIEATFMASLCDYIYNNMHPIDAIYYAMWTFWNAEQNDPNGIRVVFDNYREEDSDDNQDDNDVFNNAFIMEHEEFEDLFSDIENEEDQEEEESEYSYASSGCLTP